MKELTKESAIEELKEVNNHLSFWMKKKRALQTFIQDENDRELNLSSPIAKAWQLYNDPEFIKTYGRKRKQEEVALLMGYSVRQVNRFLKEKDS